MPVTIKKDKRGYKIVEKATGKVKGRSKTKKKAIISAAIRNKAYKDKRKKE